MNANIAGGHDGRGGDDGIDRAFMIGAIQGVVFAQIADSGTTGGAALRGVALGVAGWLVMMIAIMPMVAGGVFGLAMPSGMMVPVATLMLHVIFGAVLGFSFAKLTAGATSS